jgi:hypothetical protein
MKALKKRSFFYPDPLGLFPKVYSLKKIDERSEALPLSPKGLKVGELRSFSWGNRLKGKSVAFFFIPLFSFSQLLA